MTKSITGSVMTRWRSCSPKAAHGLAAHPEKDLIARRYLKHRRNLARAALARLAPEEVQEAQSKAPQRDSAEEALEAPIRLNDQRMEAVDRSSCCTSALKLSPISAAARGSCLRISLRDDGFTRIIGLDASARSLERAAIALKLNLPGGRPRTA